LEGLVPGVVLRAAVLESLAHVKEVFNFETSGFEVLLDVGVGVKRRKTVTEFDGVADTAVFFVGVVVVLGQNPFIADEARARLQDTENFSEELNAISGVAGGFNSVGTIDGGVSEGHLVEVTADVVGEVIKTEAGIVALGTRDLVGVVVDTSDLSASEADHVAEGTTNTAAEIDELVVVVPTSAEGEVVFVAFGSFFSGFAHVARGEVEGLTPTVLVEVSDEIVVFVDEGGGVGLAVFFGGVLTVEAFTKLGGSVTDIRVFIRDTTLLEERSGKHFTILAHV